MDTVVGGRASPVFGGGLSRRWYAVVLHRAPGLGALSLLVGTRDALEAGCIFMLVSLGVVVVAGLARYGPGALTPSAKEGGDGDLHPHPRSERPEN